MKKVIMVVDDDKEVMEVFVDAIQTLYDNYEVIGFICPKEALKNLSRADIILTDYMMPGITGDVIKSEAIKQGKRAYIITGFPDIEIADLYKPFSFDADLAPLLN